MLRILKHMKPHTGAIILIIALLFVQAISDLSLPDYMAKIINIGIQQEGIEGAVPKVIRKAELDKITLFMDDADKDTVMSSYRLLEADKLDDKSLSDYKKKYPLISDAPLYELEDLTEEALQKLNDIMGKPILVVSAIGKFGLSSLTGGTAMPALPPGVDPYALIAMLPAEQKSIILTKMDERFASMPSSIVTQSAPLYIKAEYDAIGIDTAKAQLSYIMKAGVNMLLVALVSMAAAVIVGYLGARVAASVSSSLRAAVFGRVVDFSSAEMDRFSTASLITRTTNDVQQIQMLIMMLFRIVIYAPILGIGGVIKVLNTDTNMSWIIMLAVGIISVIVLLLFVFAIPLFKKVQGKIDKLNLVTREALTGLSVIRAFSKQKHEEARFDAVNRDLTRINLFVNRMLGLMMPVMMLMMNAIAILIVWTGAHQIDLGNMQVGSMMAFIQYSMQIIMAFLMISIVSIMVPRASVSIGRIDEVLGTETSVKDPEAPMTPPAAVGSVEFKDVAFKYPDAEDYVLCNISFKAEPGRTTAIVGGTGSGKSTLINLIPRFFDVTEGQILLDGLDIRRMSMHELRERIGYVPQKGVLFSGTIGTNLRYGREDASEQDLAEAASTAQALDFISDRPEGFDSEISQGGTNVSGGQKQRLSIARALVKKPGIYIFDDTFSALDFKTDAALRKALAAKTGGATILIVAQRIGTIMNADKIVVLDEGEIVGIGRHEELMKDCEVYRQIALSQLSPEELSR
ncbi:MAG TPA: ABC transporter ATP-binding protein [Bacillota bacterium]|nr:ABC transporter ATP-binding protein [Bacillota bacterium]HOH10804.1 ABC transporter ATP-binding protein [Bacillota bacterium]